MINSLALNKQYKGKKANVKDITQDENKKVYEKGDAGNFGISEPYDINAIGDPLAFYRTLVTNEGNKADTQINAFAANNNTQYIESLKTQQKKYEDKQRQLINFITENEPTYNLTDTQSYVTDTSGKSGITEDRIKDLTLDLAADNEPYASTGTPAPGDIPETYKDPLPDDQPDDQPEFSNSTGMLIHLDQLNLIRGGADYRHLKQAKVKSLFNDSEQSIQEFYGYKTRDLKNGKEIFKNCDEVQKHLLIKFFELNKCNLIIYKHYVLYYKLLVILNNIILLFEEYDCGLEVDVPLNMLDLPPLIKQNRNQAAQFGGGNIGVLNRKNLSASTGKVFDKKILSVTLEGMKARIHNYGKEVIESEKALLHSFSAVKNPGMNPDTPEYYTSATDLKDQFASFINQVNKAESNIIKNIEDNSNVGTGISGYDKFKTYKLDFSSQAKKEEVSNLIFICHEMTIILLTADKKLYSLLSYLLDINKHINFVMGHIINILESIDEVSECATTADAKQIATDMARLIKSNKALSAALSDFQDYIDTKTTDTIALVKSINLKKIIDKINTASTSSPKINPTNIYKTIVSPDKELTKRRLQYIGNELSKFYGGKFKYTCIIKGKNNIECHARQIK